jgi:glyoxylase-like metal-dependent hydrolase (beta-lactamase superfamily II)
MTLEDSVGDIIRKARQSANVSAEQAAAAAGLSAEEFSALEDSGKSSRRPDFHAVAKLVALHGPKLQRIAEGWTPGPIDLGQWRELRQITTSGSGMSVNCYLAWDEVTREAALFDTGFDAQPIFEWIDREQLQLKHLFITHTHHDHIAAVAAIRDKFPKVKLHSNAKSAPPDQRNRTNDFIHLGSLRITNRNTPGHAEDGVTYVIGTWPDDAPNVAVVGDAIFAGSIGGARELADLAKQKIQDQIFSLPSDTLICPGHGPVTTVALERANNPFFV